MCSRCVEDLGKEKCKCAHFTCLRAGVLERRRQTQAINPHRTMAAMKATTAAGAVRAMKAAGAVKAMNVAKAINAVKVATTAAGAVRAPSAAAKAMFAYGEAMARIITRSCADDVWAAVETMAEREHLV